ncbi:MAG: cofactor-independent phosphoglycerate mutase [Candidatus Bathyarchaeota archaeon]|nr:cofactor-independent phosphoglycerate mutase [Candidatus Bathyarchaeota archaeon]
MKYVVVIGDGMADYPSKNFKGKTPLEVAEHPNMDMLASKGLCGVLNTIPDGMDAGSDIAIMSILGYNPKKYYTGRGSLEAVALGVKLRNEDIAFRCNLATEEGGFLTDYSANHITTEEASKLIDVLNSTLGEKNKIKFHLGVGYRHILVLTGKEFSSSVDCKPPHDYVGKEIYSIMVKPKSKFGIKTAELLNKLILYSKSILSTHPVNVDRVKRGLKPANIIWPWSPSKKPKLPSFKELYGLKGAVISAVPLVKGIGLYAKMSVINVPGATGFIDTNYEGKAIYALKALKKNDLVVIHVEAPDEAGHLGSFSLKVKAIEDIDKRLIGNLLSNLEDDYAFTVLSDHPTPVSIKTHVKGEVPFLIYSTKWKAKKPLSGCKSLAGCFCEKEAKKTGIKIDGVNFMSFFLKTSTEAGAPK